MIQGQAEGCGIAVIAGIADIARDRKDKNSPLINTDPEKAKSQKPRAKGQELTAKSQQLVASS